MSKDELLLDLCEKAFLREAERTDKLANKAEKLLAAVGVVFGLQLLNLQDHTSGYSIAASVALWISLLLAFLGMRVRGYKGYPRNLSMLEKLEGSSVSDAAKSTCRLYLEVREANAKLNDRVAHNLLWGVILLIVGFTLAVSRQLLGPIN